MGIKKKNESSPGERASHGEGVPLIRDLERTLEHQEAPPSGRASKCLPVTPYRKVGEEQRGPAMTSQGPDGCAPYRTT